MLARACLNASFGCCLPDQLSPLPLFTHIACGQSEHAATDTQSCYPLLPRLQNYQSYLAYGDTSFGLPITCLEKVGLFAAGEVAKVRAGAVAAWWACGWAPGLLSDDPREPFFLVLSKDLHLLPLLSVLLQARLRC